MNNKSTILALIVVAIIAIGSSILFKPTINVGVSPTPVPVTVNVPEQKAPVVNVSPQVRTPDIKVNVPEQSPVLGAVSGPDFYFDYFGINGVREYSSTRSLRQATTTVCSIKSPSATSTLKHAAIRFSVASTSATYTEMGKASTAFATTTRIGSIYLINANAQATIVASTTGSVAGDATIFAPNEYFNVKVSWSMVAGKGSVPTGVCNAQFIEI